MVKRLATNDTALSTQLRRFVRNPSVKCKRVGLYQKSQVSATVNGKTRAYVGNLREQNLVSLLEQDAGFKVIEPNPLKGIRIEHDVRVRLGGPSWKQKSTSTNIEIKHLKVQGNHQVHDRIRITGASGIHAIRRKQKEMLAQAKENKVSAFLVTIFNWHDKTMTTKYFPPGSVNRAINKLGDRAFAQIKNENVNARGFAMSKQFWECAAETPDAWSETQDGCDLSVNECENTWNVRSLHQENEAYIAAFEKLHRDRRQKPNTRYQVKTRHGNLSVSHKQIEIVYKELKKSRVSY